MNMYVLTQPNKMGRKKQKLDNHFTKLELFFFKQYSKTILVGNYTYCHQPNQ